LDLTKEIQTAMEHCAVNKPLPHPIRLYIPVPKEKNEAIKAMTIGVGFRCRWHYFGRQPRNVSPPEKILRTKAVPRYVNQDRSLALIGAGQSGLAKEVWEKLLKKPIDSIESTQEAIEAILNDMGRFCIDLPIELLITVAVGNDDALFEFRGRAIQKTGFGVVGSAIYH
jgi:hypothetical protein